MKFKIGVKPLKSKELLKKTPRERILETAGHLFNLKGIRATGVDTLIAESGVAKMTFYKHFPTKQALVMEYLKQRDDLIISRLKQTCSSATLSAFEKLLNIFDLLKELYNDPNFRGCVFINAIIEARNSDSQEHIFSTEHKKEFWRLLKNVAIEAKMKNSDAIADQVFLLFQGAVVCVQIENSDKPITTAKEMARKLLQ